MESAFAYLGSLVDAFEDVGKGTGNKNNSSSNNNDNNPTSSAWDQACGIDVTDSAEDCVVDSDSVFDDMEFQQSHPRLTSFDDEAEDYDTDYDDEDARFQQSARILSVPSSMSEKKSVLSTLRSKSKDVVSLFALLQSFSGASSAQNSLPGIAKSVGSNSHTTDESSDGSSDFDWAHSLSSDSRDENTSVRKMPRAEVQRKRSKKQRLSELPPPPGHLQWFGHGLVWTCVAITFAWVGLGLSIAARQSTHFVTLAEPMYLDPRYETIPAIGMIQIELCFNNTHLDILEELGESDEEPNQKAYDGFDDDSADSIGSSVVDDATTPCIKHRLTSDDNTDDFMYQLSRSTAFLAIALGGFITICLTFSAYWKTINLRPIGAGFLVAYFLQSFTFLIFDSSLCKDNLGCSMSRGGIYSAIASACWIIACAASARMDHKKFRAEKKREALAKERHYRQNQDYFHFYNQQMAAKAAANRKRPQQITIPKEIRSNANPVAVAAPPVTMKQHLGLVEEHRRQPSPKPNPKRPTPMAAAAVQDRTCTANDTETVMSEEDPAPDRCRDLNQFDPNPIYIPTLPRLAPPTPKRALLKQESKKPRPASPMSNDKTTSNSSDEVVEEPKKPRPTKSKSKSKSSKSKSTSKSKPTSEAAVESKKSRSKKSKPRGENLETQEFEDPIRRMSQSSLVSSGTKEEESSTKKPKSSKRSKESSSSSSKKSKKIQYQKEHDKQERPRRKSSSMKTTNGNEEVNISTRVTTGDSSSREERNSSRSLHHYPINVKKPSSNRNRENVALIKASLRKAIDEGKQYEL